MDRRFFFCVCSFMQKIYVIGGFRKTQHKIGSSIASCMCYDIKRNKWTYTASMIKSRTNASCAVFEGKIFVTGGIIKRHKFFALNSTEAYCFHENEWTQFPDMLVKRGDHVTVSMCNKLFVIDRNNCEVFESVTNKFLLIENLPEINLFVNAVSIGYKIYVFKDVRRFWCSEHKNEMLILSYNNKQNALIQESKVQSNCRVFNCAKMSKK